MPQYPHHDLEDLARQLEGCGDFRVLRRLVPRPTTPTPVDYSGRIGVIIDVETTGLDHTTDEVIELGMVAFRYSAADEITGVSGLFQSFHQPSIPIPAEVTKLTGITDEMVLGHTIDPTAVKSFVAAANIIIAHNANFDRKFAERAWPIFQHKPWACSMKEINWKHNGFTGAKLGYLLAEVGLFHEAHRAVDDCHALLEILARPLPGASTTALAALLARARCKTVRIWAENSPIELKDTLKRRGYNWNDGTDGSPRAWHIDVEEDERDAELNFLRNEIYQRDVDIRSQPLTAWERFSERI